MRATVSVALVCAALFGGCRDAAAPAPRAVANDDGARRAGREKLLARVRAYAVAHPTEGAALYVIAQLEARLGRADAALDALARLDALGWDFPPDDRAFPSLRGDTRYRTIADVIAARAPHASTSTVAFTIAERGLVPEGIAFDARSGAFFVSSVARRKIVAVDPAARDLVSAGRDGLMEALGMKVDAARNFLWVASSDESTGSSGVFAFDPSTGALRRRAFLSGGHELNDLALDARGSLFVTDTIGGGVYLMVPAADTLLPYLEPGTFVYPNGIALSESPPRVLVADLLGITVVDREKKSLRPLLHDAHVSLGGIDGMALEGRALYAVQSGLGGPRVVRFDLDDALERVERATVLETDHAALQVPTTGVVANGAFHFVANSQLDVDDRRPDAMREVVVLKTPL